jgi:hypothetical protein
MKKGKKMQNQEKESKSNENMENSHSFTNHIKINTISFLK